MNNTSVNVTVLNRGVGSNDPDITHWWSRARHGDEEAFAKLFDCYIGRLQLYVRRSPTKQDRADGFDEDLASETMTNVWLGITQGRFGNVSNRDELWFTMMSIAKSRALDRRKFLHRKKRLFGIPGQLATFFQGRVDFRLPSDEFEFLEVWEKFTTTLPNDEYREIARKRMDGMKVNEIATKLESVPKSVRRKLGIIRGEWEAFAASQNYL